MAFVTAEEIQRAREIDAFSYLQAYMPCELVNLGNGTYCTKTHDSLKLSHGKWFWWSQGFGGHTALDYLVKVEGMDFVEAVQMLNSRAGYVPSIVMPKAPTEKKISIQPHNFDCKTARQYLRKRCIDDEVIDFFISQKMLAEETKTGYCMFFGLDENGKPKYGSVRATDGRDFKKDLFGSDKKYAFGVCTNTENKCVRVFESAIDLMSFATLMKQAGKDFYTENMISLAGVYEPKKDVAESKVPVVWRDTLTAPTVFRLSFCTLTETVRAAEPQRELRVHSAISTQSDMFHRPRKRTSMTTFVCKKEQKKLLKGEMKEHEN